MQSTGHSSSSSRTLLPINQRKKRVKQEARIAEEITKLNLPPPPSALQEQHPELQSVQEVAKKKGTLLQVPSLCAMWGTDAAKWDFVQ